MSALISGSRTLVVLAAISLFGLITTADAAPFNNTSASAKIASAGTDLLFNVGGRRYRYYYNDDYGYYDDYAYVYRPYRYYRPYRTIRPYGFTYGGRRYYDDDYVYRPYVRRPYRGGLYIRAPYVDLYIP